MQYFWEFLFFTQHSQVTAEFDEYQRIVSAAEAKRVSPHYFHAIFRWRSVVSGWWFMVSLKNYVDLLDLNVACVDFAGIVQT